MATTSNYSWQTPDNSAYVKDGASAIRTLGSSVDTTLFTALGGAYPGMRLIRKTTIGNGVASVSLGATGNPLFSSTYENYRIIYAPLASSTTGSNLLFRMRNGSTDNSSAIYNWAGNAVNFSGTASQVSGASQTSGFLGYGSYTAGLALGIFAIDVINPFLAQMTQLDCSGIGVAVGGTVFRTTIGNYVGANTSFDGITFTPSAGTLTGGTIYVYGYGAS
jgi:hypothetical protein